MLHAAFIKLARLRVVGFSGILQGNVCYGTNVLQAKFFSCQGTSWRKLNARCNMKIEGLRTIATASNSINGSIHNPPSTSGKFATSTINQNQGETTSSLKCRIIQPFEFNSAFEEYVFNTFFLAEPIDAHLGQKEPDECIMSFIRQLFQRAKEDGLSLGIYDDTNGQHQQRDEKNPPDSINIDGRGQSYPSIQSNRLQFPVCYIINIVESIDDPPGKNDIMFDLNKAPVDKRHIYECIGDILVKVGEGVNLYSMYGARRLLQSFIAGVDPRYSNQGLFTRLKLATIELARAKKIDLIYSKASSRYSTRANLKLGFQPVRTLDYSSYKDAEGRHILAGMSTPHEACTLNVKTLHK